MNFREFMLRESLDETSKRILYILGSHAKTELSADEIASELSVSTGQIAPFLKQLIQADYVFRGLASDGSGQITYVRNPSKRPG